MGPRSQRPARLDLAWHSAESNQVGLHEFASWLDSVGSELMLAVNLGTRGTLEALDLLEYTNLRSGSARASQRAANGRASRSTCGCGASGTRWTARGSSVTARRTTTASSPRRPLARCGCSIRPSSWSSAAPPAARCPPSGNGSAVVLSHTYDDVDYISCHAYYEEKDGDLGSFLASSVDMDEFIESVIATVDHVKATKRSDHVVNLSFDEWNVWYNTRFETVDKITGAQNWPTAPRLLEDAYSVADAVVVGSLLISLLRRADRVTSASLAQLVNVIAPIMTEPGGIAWKQTTFFPFAVTSELAIRAVDPHAHRVRPL